MADSFPDGVPHGEFCRLYREALERHQVALVEGLSALLARTDFSSPVDELELGVFPDETGDGHVSVWCYLNGPNRRVSRTEPTLFAGKSTCLSEGVSVPLHDPDAYDFDTADASTSVVMEWVEACWQAAGGATYALPAVLTGHESCCGSGEMRPLNDPARARLAPRRGRPRGSGAK